MELKDIIIIGVALAMDALGVTIGIGVNTRVNRKRKIGFIISFAFFQFILFFCGRVGGFFFNKYIMSIPNILGGITILIVGIIMIKEGFNNKEDSGLLEKKLTTIILGVSVSIDALIVGFTVIGPKVSNSAMFIEGIIVGIITLLLCTTGFYSCKYIRKVEFISKYADFLGGIMLILFAIKMLIM